MGCVRSWIVVYGLFVLRAADSASSGLGYGAHSLTLAREGSRAVFPMPLQQDAEIFSAQRILSSAVATDVVVFVHLPINVLKDMSQPWWMYRLLRAHRAG